MSKSAIPQWWPEAEQLFKAAPGVESATYQGTNQAGEHLVALAVYDQSDGSVSDVVQVFSLLRERYGVQLKVEALTQAEGRRSLPSECPTCQVPWRFCRRQTDHQYDARQQAERRRW